MTIRNKRSVRSFVSLLCVLAMLFGLTATVTPTVFAASEIVTIKPGETWSDSWSALQTENYMDMTVDQTGFYTLTVADHQQSGHTSIYLYDATDDWYLGYISETIGATPYESKPMFLTAEHVYSLEISYVDPYDGTEYYDADMSISLEAATYAPTRLPSVAASASSVMLSLSEGDHEWFCFTAPSTGDYTMNFSSSLGAYVSMYEAATGTCVDERDTQYYNYGTWMNGTRAAFTLEANTEYYFQVANYNAAVTARVSMTKNEKAVSLITLDSPTATLDCEESPWSVQTLFSYTVTYTDGTSRSMSYDSLCTLGLEMPFVSYLGDYVDANGEWMLAAGERPVVATYRGAISYATISVVSMTDWLVGIDAGVIAENDRCRLTNDGVADDLGYYRVKVDKTGLYDLYANSDDWALMDDITFVFLDAQNHPVQEFGGCYPLVAGEEYALSVRFTYAEDAAYELVFWPQCEQEKLFPDASPNGWYHNAVTYAVGRGVISGYQNGKFGTSDGIQRQDFLVMLARMDGVDLSEYADTHGLFPDVAKNSYYEAAVAWGYENGIVTGYQSGKFGVSDKITREQLVTFLQRYARYKGYEAISETPAATFAKQYTDYKNVTAFAKDAVAWALDNGVIKGKTASTIAPQGNAQRCEVAQMLYNIFVNDVL